MIRKFNKASFSLEKNNLMEMFILNNFKPVLSFRNVKGNIQHQFFFRFPVFQE